MRIAIVDGSTVLKTWHTETGEVATRYPLPNGDDVSPVSLGWSSGDYAVIEVEPFVVPEGKRAIGSASYEVVNSKAVETFDVEDIPVEIPDRVTARQFKLQLLADDLLATVEGWIATQPQAVQIAYDNSGTFVRYDPVMESGFTALGFTDEQIDEFFIAAGAR